jgi:phospho-N-acetylmuramoyl-pentapeptide-transferase
MLYLLAHWLKHYWFPFNVFLYISFRAWISFLVAFLIVWVAIPKFIKIVKKLYAAYGGVVREYLDHHGNKAFTPTLGGTVIVLALLLVDFLFLRPDTPYPYVSAFVLTTFALIGFVDDWLKITKKDGLRAKVKFVLQLLFGFATALLMVNFLPIDTKIYFPFFKELHPDLGIFYPLWATIFIVGISNAVNITDGLDGLAIGASLTTATVLAFTSYLAGNYIYAHYLDIPYVPYAGELSILLAAFIGAGLAFLWYNTFPAKIFMGDVGSLSIGAFLGFVALTTKSEFILLIAGGLFILEVLSVIVQVTYYKYTKRRYGEGKRILPMAPLHHTLEKLGWKEPQIVVRLWIISILCGIVSLTLLKLR